MNFMDYDDSQLPNSNHVDKVGSLNAYGMSNPKHIDIENVNEVTVQDYGFTKEEIEKFIYGIHVIDPETGQEMPDSYWDTFISQGISLAEQQLGIDIFPRLIGRERHDFNANEFASNNYIMTEERPIIQVQDIQMMFNNQTLMTYPSSMWKVSHLTGEIQTYPSSILNGAGYRTNLASPTPLGTRGIPLWGQSTNAINNYDPQVHIITYVAGLLPAADQYRVRPWEMPISLRSLVAKYALKEVIEIWGELILKPGQASTHLSVDGISQSIDTTLSAMYTGGTARIDLIDRAISELLEGLRGYFGGKEMHIQPI